MICCYTAFDFDDFTLLSRQPIEIIIRICIDQRSWHKHQLSSADSLGVGCLTGNKKGYNETVHLVCIAARSRKDRIRKVCSIEIVSI